MSEIDELEELETLLSQSVKCSDGRLKNGKRFAAFKDRRPKWKRQLSQRFGARKATVGKKRAGRLLDGRTHDEMPG